MVYFDNAATTRTKPEVVYDAYNYYVREIGVSPGRGSYVLAIQASRMLYQSRKTVAKFFGSSNPSNVVFTKNSTEAINFFLRGYLEDGDHVLISPYEHNAVLRPLHMLKEEGRIDYTVLPEIAIDDPTNELCKYIRPTTKLLAITLASNLTGQIVFTTQLSKTAHKYGLKVFLDSSQGAGKLMPNMQRDAIDYLAFTGHKDLMALPGVGGFVSLENIRIRPLIQGGTGIHGESYINPEAYPDSYEAGTLNMPAIWSLKTALDYIIKHHEENSQKESALLQYLVEQLRADDRVTIYRLEAMRVPTICFNIDGIPSSEVVRKLDMSSICVRGGIHCAILAHQTIGTVETGAVRISLNYQNTKEEIDYFCHTIKEMK